MQRILVVDDDREEVEVLSFLLRRAGFEPTVTFDASSAQQLFDELQPDLVILDVRLGDRTAASSCSGSESNGLRYLSSC